VGRTSYTPEQKAAVLAALLAGQSISQASEQFGIPLGTVNAWSSRQRPQMQPNAPNALVKKEMGDLILEYLRQVLTTLTAQQRVFADEEWLRKQPASELAVLHGVSADKAFRLLEAFKPEPTEDTTE
jgi:transposase-like protein